MKLFNEKILLALLLLISIGGYVTSCTHENATLPPPSTNTPDIKRGDGVFLPGSYTAGDTSSWKFDKAHSSVLWSANYLGAPGLLTGRFNQFGVATISDAQKKQYTGTGQPLKDSNWAFYENDPAKTYFNGYVQMNQSNTGEPGRDGGCYLGYVAAPKIIASTQNLIDSNIALIKTTKVEFDPNSAGYIVTATMTWKGLLSAPKDTTITGILTYNKRTTTGEGTASAYDLFGLIFTFSFNCRTFGMTTEEVGDVITIEANMNFNNK
jgi:polyisoprenoid-binding protein YceI